MKRSHYFFAGGGTGGHIYPALAVAEQIRQADSDVHITFFCSERAIDSHILAKTGYEFFPLPVMSFSLRPDRTLVFFSRLMRSYRLVREKIFPVADKSVVIGTGGFASAPAVCAAHRLDVPVAIINVDIVPGRANRLLARFAKEIFVQFEDTAERFANTKAAVNVVGCPLREGFGSDDRRMVIDELGLDENKKTLVVTGASSGSMSINDAVCALAKDLEPFGRSWQMVHITGKRDYERAQAGYVDVGIGHKIIDYFDDMPDLLACADVVVGRAGAVSIAEYAAAGVAAICLPYPYHKDRHQYLNAAKLVEAGGAVIVDDVVGDCGQTSKNLLRELTILMADDEKRQQMGQNGRTWARLDAAERIAQAVMSL
ncbi:MAG: hypothetical protein DRP65_11690 [Planctomycetota bacterium]|nr:MAG: hypothetical protein DRP65_11690 [Planctomycetota bacterium]